MQKCAHCATPVPDDARFCHSCGSLVSDAGGQARASGAMTQESFDKIEELLRKETAGDYEIKQMLGKGGMAVVYLAREVHLARNVAIKVLPPELTFGHGVERFKREAKTAAALDHPNIIPIYRVSSGGTLFWYAMKFLEGQSLEQLLKERGKIPLDLTIKILEQVADALDYAHEHQVVHRDMKPANVMLDNRNRVIVTDFGIAKALSEGTLTASGSVIGTPYFMSPEQGMGKMVSGASDQYSVGVMAYRMLSGHVPFEGDSAIDVLHKHCMVQPPPLETAAPGLPRHVYLAVHRALEKNPERRLPNVRALVQALKDPNAMTGAAVSLSGTDESDATLVVSADQVAVSDLATTPMPSLAQSAPGTAAGARAATRPPRPAPPPVKKKGFPLGMVLGLLAVIVAAGGGTAYYLSTRGGPAPPPTVTEQTQPPAQQPPATTQTSPVAEQPAQGTATGEQAKPPAETAAQQPPSQPERTRQPSQPIPLLGTLVVARLPQGATIIVDDTLVVRESNSVDLPAGRHVVKIQAPNYEMQEERVVIMRGRPQQMTFNARPITRRAQVSQPPVSQPPTQPPETQPKLLADQGIFRLTVAPVAEIFIGGDTRGIKSRLVDTLLAGGYRIHLVPLDRTYADSTFDVSVTPGLNDALFIQLRRR